MKVPHAHKATAFHYKTVNRVIPTWLDATFLTSNRGLSLFEDDAFVVVVVGGSTSIGVDIFSLDGFGCYFKREGSVIF